MVWVLSLGFPIFQGANLLLVQYYFMVSAAAVYDNGNYVLYSRMGPVILGHAENAHTLGHANESTLSYKLTQKIRTP